MRTFVVRPRLGLPYWPRASLGLTLAQQEKTDTCIFAYWRVLLSYLFIYDWPV